MNDIDGNELDGDGNILECRLKGPEGRVLRVLGVLRVLRVLSVRARDALGHVSSGAARGFDALSSTGTLQQFEAGFARLARVGGIHLHGCMFPQTTGQRTYRDGASSCTRARIQLRFHC